MAQGHKISKFTQGGLACYCPWGRKESDTTEGLNWTELTKLRLPE